MYQFLFNLLCFQYKVVTVEYFLDSATMWEIENILECIPYCDRNLWETQRLGTYINAKAHFKGIKSIQDICQFKWEKQDQQEEEEKEIEISDDEIKRLKELSRQWQEKSMT